MSGANGAAFPAGHGSAKTAALTPNKQLKMEAESAETAAISAFVDKHSRPHLAC
jgi:hypothetical protein